MLTSKVTRDDVVKIGQVRFAILQSHVRQPLSSRMTAH